LSSCRRAACHHLSSSHWRKCPQIPTGEGPRRTDFLRPTGSLPTSSSPAGSEPPHDAHTEPGRTAVARAAICQTAYPPSQQPAHCTRRACLAGPHVLCQIARLQPPASRPTIPRGAGLQGDTPSRHNSISKRAHLLPSPNSPADRHTQGPGAGGRAAAQRHAVLNCAPFSLEQQLATRPSARA
jgi:hypothetical protein